MLSCMLSCVIEEDKQTLFIKAQHGCQKSLTDLCEEHENLVYLIAKKYLIKKDYEDIIQVGKMALIKSILKFDLTKNVRFSTYAYPSIEGEIKRYFRDNHLLKVGRKIIDHAEKVRRFIKEYENIHMQTPTVQEIANGTGLTNEEIHHVQEINQPFLSLDAPIHADEDAQANLMERLADGGKDPYDEYLQKDTLKQAMEALSEKEKTVLFLRYIEGELQTDVARTMGISQVHVSRLEKKALVKIKKKLTAINGKGT